MANLPNYEPPKVVTYDEQEFVADDLKAICS